MNYTRIILPFLGGLILLLGCGGSKSSSSSGGDGENRKVDAKDDEERPWFAKRREGEARKADRDEDKEEKKGENKNAARRAAQKGKVAWTAREKQILSAAQSPYVVKNSIVWSPDRKRVAAYLFRSGTPGYELVLDGKSVKPPDGMTVTSTTCAFSGDSKHFAYTAGKTPPTYVGGFWGTNRVILDDKVIVADKNLPKGVTNANWQNGLALNHDGSQVAYGAVYPSSFGGTYYHFVIQDSFVDGENGTYFSSYALNTRGKIKWARSFTDNADGYAAKVRINGDIPVRATQFVFSADGKSHAYMTDDGPVVNGKSKRRFPNSSSLVLSHDGKNYAHLVIDKLPARWKYYIVIDGKPYRLTGQGSWINVSRDGKQWSCQAGSEMLAGEFGMKGPPRRLPIASGATVTLSKNHRHVAYFTSREPTKEERKKGITYNPVRVWHDGKKMTEHARILNGPFLSEDGSKCAWVAMKTPDSDPVLWVNDKPGVSFDHIQLFGFAPNDSLFGVAKDDFTWRLTINGVSRKLYDSLVDLNDDGGTGGQMGFTDDGAFTYLAVRDRVWYLVTERP